MSDLFPVPDNLDRAEYALLIFQFEVREYFDLPPLGLLRLRREFLQGIRALRNSVEENISIQLHQLLEPSVPDDPQLRRQVQRPAPPLVLRPDLERNGLVEPGDWLELPVLFLGRAIRDIEAFARLLQQLGKQGLMNGQGLYDLAAIEVEDGSGRRTTLWNGGDVAGVLTPVVNDLKWWLERQPLGWNQLQLDFVSPTRLLHKGKPLFKASFSEIFPFILRRVTSMLSTHCHIETVSDPSILLSAACELEERKNHLQWRDCRTLAGEEEEQNLGGLYGMLELAGGSLADILWVLQLGSLFQIGKGAPYGSGRYQLSYQTS